MDWLNNPRIDIENRIKQLDKRFHWLLSFVSSGCINFGVNGVATAFYPTTINRKKRDKAIILKDVTYKQLQLKRAQLRTF